LDNKIEEITSILMQQIKQYELEFRGSEKPAYVGYLTDGRSRLCKLDRKEHQSIDSGFGI